MATTLLFSTLFVVAPEAAAARGPLRVHPANPRYFTDGVAGPDGRPRALLLTGAHTWNSLADMGRSDPPEAFDFAAYLDFLVEHHHNFIRLWAWDSTVWDTRANGRLGKDFIHVVAPLPYARTGPGLALDGKPKFDLTRYDPVYFQRLRERVAAAGERGIYVSVMLFEGWALFHGNRRAGTEAGWAWRSHPYHPDNNINGVDGGKPGDPLSGAVHSLTHPAINALQQAYLAHVVETVGDLDNVLYEVINEGGSKDWDWWVVDQIHALERDRPKQHPIGITGHGAERVDSMLASPADWISPGRQDGFGDSPPAWNETRPSLLDTDHVYGAGGNVAWVWRAFLGGHNPLFMDCYDGSVLGEPNDARWPPVRLACGDVRRLAERCNLAALTPQPALASSGYCLADPGRDYLVLVPEGEPTRLDLSAAAGELTADWFDPNARRWTQANVTGGGTIELRSPFDGWAVAHLHHG